MLVAVEHAFPESFQIVHTLCCSLSLRVGLSRVAVLVLSNLRLGHVQQHAGRGPYRSPV